MKYFVVADVHGFYPELQEALDRAGFDSHNPEHIFVSLGDLFDRCDYPIECLKFVLHLPKERCVLIRGNHEDLMEAAIARGDFRYHDWHNGTVMTALSLCADPALPTSEVLESVSENELYRSYIERTIPYYETKHYIFVHGWIPCRVSYDKHGKEIYTKQKNWRKGDWEKARWFNGMELWHQGIKFAHKTILCGHWHTSYGHSKFHNDGVEFIDRYADPETPNNTANYSPFVDLGIVALDACTAVSHSINCFVLTEGEK